MQIDHCCGRYDDPEYKSEDPLAHQLLCSNCNAWKRDKCQACVKTGHRFDAKRITGEKLGWHEGGREYQGTCRGCYLHDSYGKEAYGL